MLKMLLKMIYVLDFILKVLTVSISFHFLTRTNQNCFVFVISLKNVFFLNTKVFGRCMIVQGGECKLLLNKERSKLRTNRDIFDGNNTYGAISAALVSEPECKIKQTLPAQTLLRKSHDQTESFLGRFIGNTLAHITNATQTQEVLSTIMFYACLHPKSQQKCFLYFCLHVLCFLDQLVFSFF